MMIFDAVADVLAERNGCDRSEITPDTRFLDLGADSLDVVEMMMDLEEKLGREVELTERVETVGELVKFLEKHYGA